MAFKEASMFIKYAPKTPHIKIIPLLPLKKDGKGYAFDNDSVTLRPGTNELKDEEWEAIQPHVKDLIGKEITPFSVTVKSGKGGKDKKAKTLKDVPVATARKIIEGCQDPETLKKWFNQELPDELLLVFSKRMRKLKVEPEEIEDANGGGLKDSDITPEGSAPEQDAETDDDDDDDEGDIEGEEENVIPDLEAN